MSHVRVETRSAGEARRVGKLVETIQHVTGSHVLALVCMNPTGEVFVTCQPGSELEILSVLADIDWSVPKHLAEEFIER